MTSFSPSATAYWYIGRYIVDLLHHPRFGFQARIPLHKPVLRGVSDGDRTRDRLDHNQELYQLSYAHRVSGKSTGRAGGALLRWPGQGSIGAGPRPV